MYTFMLTISSVLFAMNRYLNSDIVEQNEISVQSSLYTS